MSESLVSVIIPTYNRASLIERAITSVIKQTYGNLEIIVVDNASMDHTAQVVGSLDDKRIKFIRHEKNLGPAASRNTGMRNAGGEFLAFLDSDDEWLPEKLSRQLEVFDNSEEKIGLVFANGYNEAEGHDFITANVPSGIYYDPQRDKFYPLRKLIATPSSWLLPMEAVKNTGFFDQSMNTWDDGDFLARVAYRYPLYFLNENLVIWHKVGAHLNVMNPSLVKDKERFLEKNIEFLKKDKDYLFRFYRALGKDALRFDRLRARKFLLEAAKIRPFNFSNISKILKTF